MDASQCRELVSAALQTGVTNAAEHHVESIIEAQHAHEHAEPITIKHETNNAGEPAAIARQTTVEAKSTPYTIHA